MLRLRVKCSWSIQGSFQSRSILLFLSRMPKACSKCSSSLFRSRQACSSGLPFSLLDFCFLVEALTLDFLGSGADLWGSELGRSWSCHQCLFGCFLLAEGLSWKSTFLSGTCSRKVRSPQWRCRVCCARFQEFSLLLKVTWKVELEYFILEPLSSAWASITQIIPLFSLESSFYLRTGLFCQSRRKNLGQTLGMTHLQNPLFSESCLFLLAYYVLLFEASSCSLRVSSHRNLLDISEYCFDLFGRTIMQ